MHKDIKKLFLIIFNFMYYWRIILLGILAVLVIFYGLGNVNLRDWDEAIYAQVSKEMILNNNYLTLHWNYKPWFEKPPLLMWITALFFQCFGVSEFWARAASAFSGVGLIFIVYLVGKLIYNRNVGFIASLILLFSYEFLNRARMGTTDTLLCFLFFVAIYGYLRLTTKDQKWWYLIWMSFALAFMLKSWAAIIMLPIFAFAIFLDNHVYDTLHSKHFWLGILFTCLLVLPWHIIMIAKYGQEFIDDYFFYHAVMRTIKVLEMHHGGPLYYVNELQKLFSPWIYLVPFAIALSIKENIEGQSRSRILLILIMIVIGFYSVIVKTKLWWYIHPLYPAFAILIAALLVQAFQSYKSLEFGGLVLATLVSVLIAPKKLILLLIFFGGIFVVTRIKNLIKKKHTFQVAAIVMFIFMIAISTSSTIWRNWGMGGSSQIAKIAEIAGKTNPDPQTAIICAVLEEHRDKGWPVYRPTVLFYSNRPIQIAWKLKQLKDLVGKNQEREIIMHEGFTQLLSPDYEIRTLAKVKKVIYAMIRHREETLK